MGWLSRRIGGLHERIMSLSELDALMDRVYYGLPTSSGTYVNVDTALQASAVWSCVQAISESIASLPCLLYRDIPTGGKERATWHRLYSMLKNGPNPEMTAREFWALALRHRLTWGNFYGQIIVDDYGAKEIWPLDPSRCKWQRDKSTKKLYLVYRRTATDVITFDFEEVFHLKGPTLDGITGLSPIAYQRQTIGLDIAATEYAARFFGNGSVPPGILKAKGKMSDAAVKRLKADWERLHAGTSNAHRVAILEEGVEYEKIIIPPEDSQFLQTRKATKEDIAAIFRVPPHKIGLLEHTNRASIEEQNIEWVIDTLVPECVLIEQAVQRDLINIGDGKRGIYCQFQVDQLLRGNMQARYAAYAQGRQWGWLSADDVREQENLNPLPNAQGQIYLTPLNMIAAGSAPDDTNPPTPAGPAVAPKDEDNPPATVLKPGGIPTTNPNGKASLRDFALVLSERTSLNGHNGRSH
jgi:HK97 family phage portal protein